jgi:hypothetical protein
VSKWAACSKLKHGDRLAWSSGGISFRKRKLKNMGEELNSVQFCSLPEIRLGGQTPASVCIMVQQGPKYGRIYCISNVQEMLQIKAYNVRSGIMASHYTRCDQKIPRLIFLLGCGYTSGHTRPNCKPTVLCTSFETSETCCFSQQATETGVGGLGATSRQCTSTHSTFLSFSNRPTPLTWLRVTFGCSPN